MHIHDIYRVLFDFKSEMLKQKKNQLKWNTHSTFGRGSILQLANECFFLNFRFQENRMHQSLALSGRTLRNLFSKKNIKKL